MQWDCHRITVTKVLTTILCVLIRIRDQYYSKGTFLLRVAVGPRACYTITSVLCTTCMSFQLLRRVSSVSVMINKNKKQTKIARMRVWYLGRVSGEAA